MSAPAKRSQISTILHQFVWEPGFYTFVLLLVVSCGTAVFSALFMGNKEVVLDLLEQVHIPLNHHLTIIVAFIGALLFGIAYSQPDQPEVHHG